MKIRMYNVEFGDCFLLQEDDEYLLVDFGSDSKCDLGKVATNIACVCKGDQFSFLLNIWGNGIGTKASIPQGYSRCCTKSR